MFPLVSSVVLVLGEVVTHEDLFERAELGSNWPFAEGLVISEGKVQLSLGRAVGRATWHENPQPADDSVCHVLVKVSLSDLPDKTKRYARACVRMARGTPERVAYARVTIWWDPQASEGQLKLECGVVGEADKHDEDVVPFDAAVEEELKLEFNGASDELKAKLGNVASASVSFGLGNDPTRFMIEAGGDASLVQLDDFEVRWRKP